MTSLVEEAFAALELTDGSGNPSVSVDAKGKEVAAYGPPNVSRPDSAGIVGDLTCAICLNQIPISETAQPDGCEHVYCTCCILHWSVYKEKPWCPQCKSPFSSLLTYRTLDGQLHDLPCKESVCLLKRAHWFQEHLKAREQAIAEASVPQSVSAGPHFTEGSIIDETDYLDYSRYYDEYDDDEEVESYYFSAAAGRARVIIGNRRHGPNGYLSSGRMQARPAAPSPEPKAQQKGKGKAGENTPAPGSDAKRSAKVTQSPAQRNPPRKGAHHYSEDDDDSRGTSSSRNGAGRRARRNQKRAAADARVSF